MEEALEQGPQAYGLPMTTWTLRDVQALLLRERGITVSVCTLHRVVHALGYRYRRPRHDLRHRQDAEAVAAAQACARLAPKKSLSAPGRSPASGPHLVYVDECEIHTHPHLAKVWRKKGPPMRVPAAGADQKCAIFGALDYASGRILHTRSARKDEDAFMTFLEELVQALPHRRATRRGARQCGLPQESRGARVVARPCRTAPAVLFACLLAAAQPH